jgi:hypothetical protein
MKRIFLAALLLLSVFGFISVITAKANAAQNQTLLCHDDLKAVRLVPAAQLTDQERAALICRGKFHACFQLTNDEMDELLGSIIFPFDCDDVCSAVDSPGCSNLECINRCWVASGQSGATSCDF